MKVTYNFTQGGILVPKLILCEGWLPQNLKRKTND